MNKFEFCTKMMVTLTQKWDEELDDRYGHIRFEGWTKEAQGKAIDTFTYLSKDGIAVLSKNIKSSSVMLSPTQLYYYFYNKESDCVWDKEPEIPFSKLSHKLKGRYLIYHSCLELCCCYPDDETGEVDNDS